MPEDSGPSRFVSDPAFLQGGALGLLRSSIDADPRLRFFDNVRMTVLRSLDIASDAKDVANSLFVLSDLPSKDARKLNPQPHKRADLDLNTPERWQGQIIVSAHHGSTGWSIPLPDGQIDRGLELLMDCNLGSSAVAAVYPSQRVMSCHLSGPDGDDHPLRLTLPATTRAVSLDELIATIEETRFSSLLTPMVGPPGLWNDGANYIPGPESERLIQWIVVAQLRSNFRPVQADIEQTTPVGRIDICMTDPGHKVGQPLHPAVIELKAFRSASSTGSPTRNRSNLLAALSGHRQAKAYRKAKAAAAGLLACFDLRSDKDDILNQEIIVAARTKYFDDQMRAAVFRIYGDPDDAQEELATA